MTTGSGSSGFRSSAPTALGQPDTAGPEHRTGGPAAGRPPIRCGWPGKSLSRRGRGCPTGIRVREQQRSFRTSVPSCSVRRLVCGERCGLGVPGERRRSSLNFTRTKGRGRRRACVRIRSADQSSACLQSLLTPPPDRTVQLPQRQSTVKHSGTGMQGPPDRSPRRIQQMGADRSARGAGRRGRRSDRCGLTGG